MGTTSGSRTAKKRSPVVDERRMSAIEDERCMSAVEDDNRLLGRAAVRPGGDAKKRLDAGARSSCALLVYGFAP
jgi:hypothetical protein